MSKFLLRRDTLELYMTRSEELRIRFDTDFFHGVKLISDVSSLAVDNVEAVRIFKDKEEFWTECIEYNLNVPKFKIMPEDIGTELANLKVQGFFGKKRRYVLKSLKNFNYTNGNIIPLEGEDFEKFLKTNEFTNEEPHALIEKIDGSEYLANLICREGKIQMLQVLLMFKKLRIPLFYNTNYPSFEDVLIFYNKFR